MFLKFFLSFFILTIISSQTCYPNFFVDQIFQNSITLEFSSQQKASSGDVKKTYNHSYWGEAFTTKPNIAYCINEMQFVSSKQIAYSVKAKVHPQVIQFTLASKGISWAVLNIQMWLFNRIDFFTHVLEFPFLTLYNKKSTVQKFFSIQTKLSLPLVLKTLTASQIQSSSKTNTQIIYQTYLTGLKSSTTSLSEIHEVNINDYLVEQTLRIQVETNYKNRILGVEVMVIIVPVETVEFVSYEVDFVYHNFVESNELLNGRFHPVFNMLLGLKSLSIRNDKQFQLRQKYDMMNSIMQISTYNNLTKASSSPIELLQLSYVSFGRIMNQVCQPCSSSYVLIDGCRSKCQEGTYEKKYYDPTGSQSGKTCVKCLSQLNMEFSTELKICVCKEGFLMSNYGTRCNKIVKNSTTSAPNQTINFDIDLNTNLKQQCPIKGTTYKNGKCVCEDPALYLIDGSCRKCQNSSLIYQQKSMKCKTIIQIEGCKQQNQQPNYDFTACVCKKSFEKFNNNCVAACSQNSGRNQTNGQCVCYEGYQMVDKKGCLKKCYANSVRDTVNVDQCVCISGYQLNQQTKQCLIIKISQLQNTSNQKQLSNSSSTSISSTSPTSSVVSQQQQKIKLSLVNPLPKFSNPGIIFDFTITPVIPHTQQQVINMFQITFSDNKLAPPTIFINQNQNNLKQYRILFDYRNNLPYRNFDVMIKVNDKKIGKSVDSIKIPVNPLNTGMNFARRGEATFLV